jgi:hypothetical protein
MPFGERKIVESKCESAGQVYSKVKICEANFWQVISSQTSTRAVVGPEKYTSVRENVVKIGLF